jgi:hypothetical protein
MATKNEGGTMFERIVVVLMVMAPTICLAGTAWDRGVSRGLDTYMATADGGRVTIACDPERVHGTTPQGTIVILMPKDRSATRVVFLAESGEQAAFDLRDGVAAQAMTAPDDWETMTGMMREGGRVAVVTARDDFTLDLTPLPSLRCS